MIPTFYEGENNIEDVEHYSCAQPEFEIVYYMAKILMSNLYVS